MLFLALFTYNSYICQKQYTMRSIDVDSFFTEDNSVQGITDEDYKGVDQLIQDMDSFVRTTYKSVYIIDYFRQGFLYVSDKFMRLCGESAENIKKFGYDLYIKYVPKEELEMLLEINRKGFALFNRVPVAERCNCVISYDFHIVHGRHKTLIHHQLTPLRLTPEGRIWLALCTMAPSARKEPGHVMMRYKGGKTYHELDLDSGMWAEKEEMALSEDERKVLLLSAQGFNMDEISGKICKSVNSVKNYKRRLFERVGVCSISEALSFATNYGLI